jgi:putative acetyltransferase
VIVRPGRREDMAAVARLFRHVMRTSLSFLPELHTPDEDLHHFGETLFAKCVYWVADEGGVVVGFIAFTPTFVEHLHLHPDYQDQGLGVALLEKAKAAAPGELSLWTFQQNARARHFYEREGFVAALLTDGADNEEKMPDVLYRWSPPGSTTPV